MRQVLTFVLTTCLFHMLVQGQVLPRNGTRRETTIESLSLTGPIPISARLVEVDYKHSNSNIWNGTLCILYDQNTGFFIWLHHYFPPKVVRKVLVGPDLFLTGGKLFRSDSQLVYFSFGTFVRSADKASSLDEAERKSILAATAKLQQSVQSIVAGLRESLNLGLGDDFRLEKYHSKGMRPSIIDVQSRGSQWYLTVQGIWKEIVTLDSNFRLISHVPAPGEKAKYWMNP